MLLLCLFVILVVIIVKRKKSEHKTGLLSSEKNLFQSITHSKEYNLILSYGVPEILAFLTVEDYKYTIFLYLLSKNISHYSKDILQEYLNKPYNYDKYEWRICIEILRTFCCYTENIKKLKEYTKKVKLICHENCECCSKLRDKVVSIDKVKELPRAECPFECHMCNGATYVVELSYDD